MAEDKAVKEVDGEKNDNKNTNKKTKKSLFSRVLNGLFRLHGDDFEKRLQYISKEEATLLARMQRRSSSWRATARSLIIFSVFLEVVAVAYAILTTRYVGLDWKMRATRVLPIFLWPALSTALYSGLFSFTRMRDRRDQKTLEALQAERQAKIDELKERTNYYTTQQLIQRYDPDPAAKAAAASVLASKLGADSGLKVFLGDESQYYPEATGRSNDVEPVKSNGLRKRNPSDARSKGSNVAQHSDKEILQHAGNEVSEVSPRNQLVVEHHNTSSFGAQDRSWIARVAALLVGEDPSQSYALICGNCHMHNGLARKEDFQVITYYCPHCRALNKPRSSGESSPTTSTLDMRSSTMEGAGVNLIKKSSGAMSKKASATSSPVADSVHASEKASATSSPVGELEVSEKIVAEDPASQ